MKPPAAPDSPQEAARKADEKKRAALSRLLDTASAYARYVRDGSHPARRPANPTLTRLAITILLTELEDDVWRPVLLDLITPERAQQLRLGETESGPENSLKDLLGLLVSRETP
jgi:hypothetical protein